MADGNPMSTNPVDCPCGQPWQKLRCATGGGGLAVRYAVECPACGRRGPWGESDPAGVAAWNECLDEWISVEDRLPEEGVEVLAFSAAYGVYRLGSHDPDNSVWHGDTGELFWLTHWRPLPAPPAAISTSPPRPPN